MKRLNNDIISLKIPSKAKYISLVRLTVSSMVYNAGFDVDEIDDIKVSMAEACINALTFSHDKDIEIEFKLDEESLTIEVGNVLEDIPNDIEEKNERELGLLIIKSLMDEVSFTSYGIEMIKYIEDDIE